MKKYYCGPFYLPKYFRKKLSKDFNLLCKIHDEGYNKQEKTRKEIDAEFLAAMLASGKSSPDRIKFYNFMIRYIIGWPSWYFIKLIKFFGFKF